MQHRKMKATLQHHCRLEAGFNFTGDTDFGGDEAAVSVRYIF